MIKLLHFADIHFGMENYGLVDPRTGLNSRLLDWNQSFGRLIDYALKNQVDGVLFAGDAFKTRDPSPTYQNAFFRGLKNLSQANIPLIIIPGNHDLPLAPSKKSALETLATLKVPHIYFSKKIDLIKIPLKNQLLQVATVPFVYKLNLCQPQEIKGLSALQLNQTLTKRLEDLVKFQVAKMDRRHPRLALAHLSVENATLGSEQMIGFGQDLLLSQGFLKTLAVDYIALGHLHRFQKVLANPPAIYPGSLERIDFSEEKEAKGFVEINLTQKSDGWTAQPKFIAVAARKFLTIRIKLAKADRQPQETVMRQINQQDIKDCVVRLIIQGQDEQIRQLSEISLRQACLSGRQAGQNAFMLGPIIKQTPGLLEKDSQIIDQTKEIFSQPASQNVSEFIKQLKASPSQKQKLAALAQKIMAKVDEQTI